MRRLAVMLGVGLAFASIGARSEPLLSPELKELATEMATAATFIGACEGFIPAPEADKMIADLKGDPQTEAGKFLGPIIERSLLAGRTSPLRNDLSAESCRNLLNDQAVRLAAAKAAAQ